MQQQQNSRKKNRRTKLNWRMNSTARRNNRGEKQNTNCYSLFTVQHSIGKNEKWRKTCHNFRSLNSFFFCTIPFGLSFSLSPISDSIMSFLLQTDCSRARTDEANPVCEMINAVPLIRAHEMNIDRSFARPVDH